MCAKISEKPTSFINLQTTSSNKSIIIWAILSFASILFTITCLSIVQYSQKKIYNNLNSELDKFKNAQDPQSQALKNKITKKLGDLKLKSQESQKILKPISILLHEILTVIPNEIRLEELNLNNKKLIRFKCHAKNWKSIIEFMTILKKSSLISCPRFIKSTTNTEKNLIIFVLNAILK